VHVGTIPLARGRRGRRTSRLKARGKPKPIQPSKSDAMGATSAVAGAHGCGLARAVLIVLDTLAPRVNGCGRPRVG